MPCRAPDTAKMPSVWSEAMSSGNKRVGRVNERRCLTWLYAGRLRLMSFMLGDALVITK